jgi:methionyl-tRNA formyltransferase
LPIDSGGGPISWRILRNDRIGMQLAHIVSEKVDKGDILRSEKYLLPHWCKLPSEHESYHYSNFLKFYQNLLVDIFSKKKIKLKTQVDYIGNYNPRLNTKINGWIDWNLTSYEILNFINAFDDPYDGASTQILGHKRVFIKKAHLHGGEITNHPFRSGLISRNDKDWIVVCTKDNQSILIEEVLDKNKKNMVSKLRPGLRFFTSPKNLFEAKRKKIIYSSSGLKII